MDKKNILLLALAISPTKGSEYSVAWNHVRFMAKYYNLHVLYASSSDVFGDTSEIQAYLKEHPIENVVFHAIQPGRFARFIYAVKKQFGKFYYARYLLYISFNMWHKTAYKYAKRLIKMHQFDIVHFLNPIGYREPGYLWKLGLPYIRGPVGGTYQKPTVLFKALSKYERIIFYIRNLINWWQFNFSIRLRKSLSKTDVLLTTTTRVQADFMRVHKKPSICLPENSIIQIHGLNTQKFSTIDKRIELIWVGRIDGNKALIIVLEALRRIPEKNYCLHVVGGDSNMSVVVKNFIKKNGLDNNVIFHGTIPRKDVFNLMDKSHLHIISSISEGHPTTQWEAMSVGLPTLTLDHCGMGDIINNRSGRKISITTYDGTIQAMTNILREFLKNPRTLHELAESTIKEAEHFTWEKRVYFYNDLYSKF